MLQSPALSFSLFKTTCVKDQVIHSYTVATFYEHWNCGDIAFEFGYALLRSFCPYLNCCGWFAVIIGYTFSGISRILDTCTLILFFYSWSMYCLMKALLYQITGEPKPYQELRAGYMAWFGFHLHEIVSMAWCWALSLKISSH